MTGGALTTTEITIEGANCPWCFNETIELLRREPGVVGVDASIGQQCVSIRHHDVALDRLLAVIRGHLHADDMSSVEHVMVEIDPQLAATHCPHRQIDTGEGGMGLDERADPAKGTPL